MLQLSGYAYNLDFGQIFPLFFLNYMQSIEKREKNQEFVKKKKKKKGHTFAPNGGILNHDEPLPI